MIAVVSIVVEKEESVEAVNAILHTYRQAIIGRMGIPYRARGVNLISLDMDGEKKEIEAMTAALGKLDGVRVSMLCPAAE
jgi:putative iron-only hydrogenase system regulator